MNDIYDFMKELNLKAAQELIKAYNDIPSDIPIKFPKYYNGKNKGKTRVSEQELRFAMAYLFNNNIVKLSNEDYSFSIETPTENEYSFSKNKGGSDSNNKGQGKRSAQTDMTLYEGGKPKINIEFKANSPKQENLDKDIEKLLRENNRGAWCHILESANDRTWKRLLGKSTKSGKPNQPGKFENAFNKVIKIKSKPIYFSFLVLNDNGKGAFYRKVLEYNGGAKDSVFNIKSEQDMVNNGWEKWEFNDKNELEKVEK